MKAPPSNKYLARCTLVLHRIHKDKKTNRPISVLLSNAGNILTAAWFPLSEIELDYLWMDNVDNNLIAVSLPVWLANEKGVI